MVRSGALTRAIEDFDYITDMYCASWKRTHGPRPMNEVECLMAFFYEVRVAAIRRHDGETFEAWLPR